MQRKATAQDVAKLAGVSRSAVSLVLNGHGDGNIASESQERIRRAAKELSYKPNAVALSLRNQQTRVIGIVSDRVISGPVDGNIIAGADAVAREKGFVTLGLDTEEDAQRDASAVETLLDRHVDALMYVTVGLRELMVPTGMEKAPAILANCFDSRGPGHLGSVLPDEVWGGAETVRHVLGAGHRRIAFLTGPVDHPAAQRRLEGHRFAFAAAGLPFPEDAVHPAGWDISDGFAAASAVLAATAENRPTVLLCANDRCAVGAVLAARALGLDVPRDVSVVGYDDEERIADFMVPALSTMALPLREIGAAAMTRLLAAVPGARRKATAGLQPDRSGLAGEELIRGRFVDRGSLGPVPPL
ncbi:MULTISPECIES: LacI family DNA-binding transcriptional regulator [Arthrobacter]|uniref:LacI family DNA-binding transcriptional regulator n=2 Tax=Arthrobacter TaxID=1663 RepID=A0ABU9KKS6_9MICC|nr:LacI family DNA-binding transcriptional regulator [Arthrobacter sp. YJM1]MDP5227509.1 LacI family DNA-binding transcriptional regulator [Arthrobacter sp. YJM1]